MKPQHLPRDPPPSIVAVIITLMLALGCVFGSIVMMLRLAQWWMGLWS